MAIQIKNDNVLIGHINELDSRLDVVENKFSEYVPLTGGGLTGPLTSTSSLALGNSLTFNGVYNAIRYVGTSSTNSMIRFLDNALNEYGTGVSIGGGGATILGGGESAINAELALTANDSEVLWLCNDGNIDFYTRYQDGPSSAVHTYIDTNGVFHTLGLTGDLFKVVNSANVNRSVSGNSGVEVQFSITIPSGYVGLCYAGYSTSGPGGAINVYSSASVNPVITGKGPGTYTCSVWFRNYTSTTYSVDLSIQIICIKGTTA